MKLSKEIWKFGKGFFLLLVLGGLILSFFNRDAISMGQKEKEGILTAEQINLAFQSVSGKLIAENVQEAQQVKKGEILLELDPTDINLSIAKTEAQINQLKGSIDIGLKKVNTSEEQSYRSIEQSKKAYDAAKSTFTNKETYYKRIENLFLAGAVSQLELDNALTDLEICRADMIKAERYLNQLLAGTTTDDRAKILATDDASGIYLPTIDQSRQELVNDRYNVENLEVALRELKVSKERLQLRAPEDGKVLTIIAKKGEMIAVNAPAILLESKRYYYNIYVDEKTASRLKEGDRIQGIAIANNKKVNGVVRLLTTAPGFADIKMSREKGQTDLSAFLVRIYIDAEDGVLPGMTIKVDTDELFKG